MGSTLSSFAEKNPQLSAVIFDWPQGIEIAEETIIEEDISSKVTTQVGEYFKDEIGDNFDTVLLFNIIHANSGAENTFLLEKVFQSLNHGGIAVILDSIIGKRRSGVSDALAAILGLNLLVETGGQTYTFEEVSSWLKEAGFVNHRCIDIMKTPGYAIILGTKP